MGQSISDIAYPDNPNRRARAEQLKSDIEAYGREYEDIKKLRSCTHTVFLVLNVNLHCIEFQG
jgi:hypothetical protein